MERELKGWSRLWGGEEMKAREHAVRIRALRGWLIVTFLPFLLGAALALILRGRGLLNMDLVSGLLMGGVVSVLIQCFRLEPFLRVMRTDWEGTVIRRKEYRLPRHGFGGGNARAIRSGKDPMDPKERFYVQYDIICSSGHGKRRLSFRDEPERYAMLPVGARLRVSPALNTFEKEDRTGDRMTLCPLCGNENGIRECVCRACGGRIDG